MLPLYAKISRDIRADRRVRLMQALLTSILRQLQERLETVRISGAGMEQLFLDVHFLMLASGAFLVESHSRAAGAVCAAAMRVFKQSNTQQASLKFREEAWYDQQARTLQARYPLDFGQL